MDVREKAASEKRLIDVNDIYSLFNQSGIARLHVADIDTIPRVDAVEVVRCRECKHWKPTGSKGGKSFSDMEYIGCCEFTKYCRRESDFCSYGERKGGAD